MGAALTIGRIAKLAGVNVETVRYYQRRGLVIEPDRHAGSYRRYPIETVAQILFIKRAQALGFSLDEIAILIQSGSALGCDQIHTLIAQKTEVLRGQIDVLCERLDVLQRLTLQCENTEGAACTPCPVVAHLSGESVFASDTARDCSMVE